MIWVRYFSSRMQFSPATAPRILQSTDRAQCRGKLVLNKCVLYSILVWSRKKLYLDFLKMLMFECIYCIRLCV